MIYGRFGCKFDQNQSLSFHHPVSYFIPPLPKLSLHVKLHVLPCSISSVSSFSAVYIYFCPTLFVLVRVTENTDCDEERNTRVVLVRGEKWKKKNGSTGEGLRREKSKCLFMPNWATDEPAAISDNSLFRRKEEMSTKGRREVAEVLQRRGSKERGSR